MEHQLTIESGEAVDIVNMLATLTGRPAEDIVTEALRHQLQQELARQERLADMRRLVSDFQQTLLKPWPSSDHNFLYDDTGLPT